MTGESSRKKELYEVMRTCLKITDITESKHVNNKIYWP